MSNQLIKENLDARWWVYRAFNAKEVESVDCSEFNKPNFACIIRNDHGGLYLISSPETNDGNLPIVQVFGLTRPTLGDDINDGEKVVLIGGEFIKRYDRPWFRFTYANIPAGHMGTVSKI